MIELNNNLPAVIKEQKAQRCTIVIGNAQSGAHIEQRQAAVIEQQGFASSNINNNKGIIGFVGGHRNNPIFFGTHKAENRPSLGAGEVAIYAHGHSLMIKESGIEIIGDVNVTGDVIANNVSLATHQHTYVDSGGSSTPPPITAAPTPADDNPPT